jgi:glycosyltransferase involved in cell wall biosynthesis
LDQTFEDFEIVVSDNASTDATPDICAQYARRDHRIRYERTKRSIPVASNFNRAFQLSRGTFFKWHAHDDLIAPTFLARCVQILHDDPSTVLAGTRVMAIETDGSPVRFDTETGTYVTAHGERIPVASPADGLSADSALERFRSILFEVNGNLYSAMVFGLARSRALAETPLMESYIGAGKVLLGRLSFVGRYREFPEELFFRTYRPGHVGSSGGGTWRGRVELAKRFQPHRRVIVSPLGQQVIGYMRAITGADIAMSDKARCTAMVLEKVANIGLQRIKRSHKDRVRL